MGRALGGRRSGPALPHAYLFLTLVSPLSAESVSVTTPYSMAGLENNASDLAWRVIGSMSMSAFVEMSIAAFIP